MSQTPDELHQTQAAERQPIGPAMGALREKTPDDPSSVVLPSYVRSLLRISVPLSVELAATKEPVSRILNLGPGSIIQFDRNCEKPLTLRVGNQPIAEGEAVKVGDKFGIKISAMILPGERIVALHGKRR